MGFSKKFIQRIKSEINLVEVVRLFTPIRKYGKKVGQYVGFCQDTSEQHPSFMINSFGYKCYSCGRGGNHISFLMEHCGNNMTYSEAIRFLIRFLNNPIKKRNRLPRSIKKPIPSKPIQLTEDENFNYPF